MQQWVKVSCSNSRIGWTHVRPLICDQSDTSTTHIALLAKRAQHRAFITYWRTAVALRQQPTEHAQPQRMYCLAEAKGDRSQVADLTD